jgi:hypothetical protein
MVMNFICILNIYRKANQKKNLPGNGNSMKGKLFLNKKIFKEIKICKNLKFKCKKFLFSNKYSFEKIIFAKNLKTTE